VFWCCPSLVREYLFFARMAAKKTKRSRLATRQPSHSTHVEHAQVGRMRWRNSICREHVAAHAMVPCASRAVAWLRRWMIASSRPISLVAHPPSPRRRRHRHHRSRNTVRHPPPPTNDCDFCDRLDRRWRAHSKHVRSTRRPPIDPSTSLRSHQPRTYLSLHASLSSSYAHLPSCLTLHPRPRLLLTPSMVRRIVPSPASRRIRLRPSPRNIYSTRPTPHSHHPRSCHTAHYTRRRRVDSNRRSSMCTAV
jgi:hypothetical protein